MTLGPTSAFGPDAAQVAEKEGPLLLGAITDQFSSDLGLGRMGSRKNCTCNSS